MLQIFGACAVCCELCRSMRMVRKNALQCNADLESISLPVGDAGADASIR